MPVHEPQPPSPPTRVQRRRTLLTARAEPGVWLLGLALIASVALVLGLVAMIVVKGSATFWPRPVDRVEMRDGGVLLGVPVAQEAFEPIGPLVESLAAFRAADEPPIEGAFDERGRPVRRLYRVANKEVMPEPFRWVPLWEVRRVTRPADAALVERVEWGVWLGVPRSIFEERIASLPEGAEWTAEEAGPAGRIVREKVGEGDGRVLVRERRYVAEGPEAAWAALPRAIRAGAARRGEIRSLDRHGLGPTNRRIEDWRLRVCGAELEHARWRDRRAPWLSVPLLGGVVAACLASAIGAIVARRGRARSLAAPAWCLALGLALLGALEHPWSAPSMDEPRLARVRARADAALADLTGRYERTLARIEELRREDGAHRVEFVEATFGQAAGERAGRPERPLLLSQVVRAVRANGLSPAGRVGVYLSRWREYLLDGPRSNNIEGGVFPVIFGTVMLTLLLSVVTVPLGVVAALYLREYARQGFVTSLIRIAVNNLAGVPSIVYGVFGLGFFCYGVGSFVDAGASEAARLPRVPWWWIVASACVLVATAVSCAGLARRKPGQDPTRRQRIMGVVAAAAWLAAAGLGLAALATTPYFHGLFRAKLPSPTFGTPGLLWAALTLALLTLPVVIVSTEEALSAVPRSMREGSFGCGASQWQTIRRIVLPAAAPGIMTGTILAMARGAGEVAPLMLVGAVKLASELPLDADPPFLHPQRSFMHLGFHIYDLGFQSPDSEAAQPLVWTTTLLLVGVVLALNLAAITIRARLRARLSGGTF